MGDMTVNRLVPHCGTSRSVKDLRTNYLSKIYPMPYIRRNPMYRANRRLISYRSEIKTVVTGV